MKLCPSCQSPERPHSCPLPQTCSNCNRTKEPHLFPNNPKKRNGLDSWCRQCANESTKSRASTQLYKSRAKSRYLASMSTPELKKSTRAKNLQAHKTRLHALGKNPEQFKEFRKKRNASQKKWRNANKHRIEAHRLLSNAIKSGRMPLVHEHQCHTCNQQAQEYHHYDGYTALRAYKVVPLCRQCHRSHHANNTTIPNLDEIKPLHKNIIGYWHIPLRNK